MNNTPSLEVIPPKKLMGKKLRMSLAQNRTFELWHSFMPHREAITNKLSADLISMQVYDVSLDFADFTPQTEFEKWAAVEVPDFDTILPGMETYIMKGGLYAVFIYKGRASEFHDTFRFIFDTWLPASEFEIDNREHFEILGAKYKNDDPDSEEEIWVPLKAR
ncbi:MAG: GyrI-like domain-containing protein [Bacteroidota bacterium]